MRRFRAVMSPMDVMPPWSWWLSFLPLIIVGVVILGVIFLIMLGVLISRRVTVTMRTSGAVALTLASILLVSGLWCMFISPTMTYTETKESLYRQISIDSFGVWNYSFSVQEGDALFGSVDSFRVYNELTNASVKAFNIRVYDPDGNIAWSQNNVTQSYFNLEAPSSGLTRVEVQNPNPQAIECGVQITVSVKVILRPLEPLGQWLSLISLPIFGLGMWASGIFTIMQKRERRVQ